MVSMETSLQPVYLPVVGIIKVHIILHVFYLMHLWALHGERTTFAPSATSSQAFY